MMPTSVTPVTATKTKEWPPSGRVVRGLRRPARANAGACARGDVDVDVGAAPLARPSSTMTRTGRRRRRLSRASEGGRFHRVPTQRHLGSVQRRVHVAVRHGHRRRARGWPDESDLIPARSSRGAPAAILRLRAGAVVGTSRTLAFRKVGRRAQAVVEKAGPTMQPALCDVVQPEVLCSASCPRVAVAARDVVDERRLRPCDRGDDVGEDGRLGAPGDSPRERLQLFLSSTPAGGRRPLRRRCTLHIVSLPYLLLVAGHQPRGGVTSADKLEHAVASIHNGDHAQVTSCRRTARDMEARPTHVTSKWTSESGTGGVLAC
jgi:hypothetical protein